MRSKVIYPEEVLASVSPSATYPLGKIALIEGVACNYTNYGGYFLDYARRLVDLDSRGVLGVVYVDPFPGMIPRHLSYSAAPAPACVMDRATWADLRDNTGIATAANPISADFTQMVPYNEVDEPLISPIITKLFLSSSQAAFDVPAMSATFNNPNSPLIMGSVAVPRFHPSCLVQAFGDCATCWARPRGPFLNTDELSGKVVFYHYETLADFPLCYTVYYHLAAIANDAGAVASVLTASQFTLSDVPGPYNVPKALSAPFFVILRTFADAVDHLVTTKGINTQLALPALVSGAGPPYFPQDAVELEVTEVEMRLFDPDGTIESDIACDAGQAVYNPLNYPGLMQGNTTSVTAASVVAQTIGPVPLCASLDSCGECLVVGQMASARDLASLRGKVAYLFEDDFPCVHEYGMLTEMVEEAGAVALVLVNDRDMTATMIRAATGRAGIPSFNIPNHCSTRIEENQTILFSLPALVDGMAGDVDDLITAERQLQLISTTKVLLPKRLRGVYPAGQTAYTPKWSQAVVGDVEILIPFAECNDRATCSLCDRLESQFHNTAEYIRGRILLFREYQGVCLRPLSNILRFAQENGASAVLFANDEDEVLTLTHTRATTEITIPSFNVAFSTGKALADAALRDNLKVTLVLPQVVNGVAKDLVGSFSAAEDALRDGGYQDSVYSGINGAAPPAPPAAPASTREANKRALIACVVTAGVCALIAAAVVAYKRHRRRRLNAFNQFDASCQTFEGQFTNMAYESDTMDLGAGGSRGEGGGAGHHLAAMTQGVAVKVTSVFHQQPAPPKQPSFTRPLARAALETEGPMHSPDPEHMEEIKL
eukprot:jgi/Mesvir1/2169/Mv16680-RA.2